MSAMRIGAYRGWVVPIALVALILPACAGLGSAEEAPRETKRVDLAPQVRSLLTDLNADQRTTRQRAERELLDLGPAVLPLLPAPELLPSPAVRASVAKIRGALERRQAQESVLPARVTLETEQSLGPVLEEISRQTGNRLILAAPASTSAAPLPPLKFDRTPFWEALDRLAERANLRFEFDPRVAAVKLAPASPSAPPAPLAVTSAGAFRVAVATAELRPIIGSADRRHLRLELQVAAEPRLRPLFLKFAAADIEARTDRNLLLPPLDPQARYDLPLGDGGHFLRTALDFVVPAAVEVSQVRLTGKLLVQTAAGHERIRFTDLPRAVDVARRRGGVTVKLLRATSKKSGPESQDATVRINVTYDAGGPAFESHRTWIFHNDAYLENAEGTQFRPTAGYDTALQRDGIVVVDYHFPSVPGSLRDYSFVYVAPTLVIDVPVEFALDRIPVRAAANSKTP